MLREGEFFEGIFRANDCGFGFVVLDGDEPDVFIPVDSNLFAMDKDRVRGKIVQQANSFGDRGAEGKNRKFLFIKEFQKGRKSESIFQ